MDIHEVKGVPSVRIEIGQRLVKIFMTLDNVEYGGAIDCPDSAKTLKAVEALYKAAQDTIIEIRMPPNYWPEGARFLMRIGDSLSVPLLDTWR